jgi:hypothetical protein
MLAAPIAPLHDGACERRVDAAHKQARAQLRTGTQARTHLDDPLDDADAD